MIHKHNRTSFKICQSLISFNTWLNNICTSTNYPVILYFLNNFLFFLIFNQLLTFKKFLCRCLTVPPTPDSTKIPTDPHSLEIPATSTTEYNAKGARSDTPTIFLLFDKTKFLFKNLLISLLQFYHFNKF